LESHTNHLSVSQHVHSVTRSCALHLYALKLLRAHGMCEQTLQQVFRSVIISKIGLCHASSAWWGFTSAIDRQHLKDFLRRSARSRLCPTELSDLTGLVEAADDKLLPLILRDYCISSVLPPKSDNHYNLHSKHYLKTLICLIVILSFVYFIKTVINILHFIFLDIFNFGLYPSHYFIVFIYTDQLQFVNFIKRTCLNRIIEADHY